MDTKKQTPETCVILTGGQVDDLTLFKELLHSSVFVIAADSGLYHAEALGIMPDLILGDFDSYHQRHEFLALGKYGDSQVMTFPKDKDFTDTELAIHEAVQRGYKDLVLIGATGTRLDHTLANVFLLKKIDEMGANGRVLDDHNEIFLMKAGENRLNQKENCYFSMIPIDHHIVVSLSGFKFPLDHAFVKFASTITISNEWVDATGIATLHEGEALGIISWD